MALNIGFNGTAVPHVKLNARNGTWSFDGKEIKSPTFVADLANLMTGHLLFRTGEPPSRLMDPDLVIVAPKPSDDHKRGFVIKIHSDELFGGVVEFSSASAHVGTAISELHDQYLKERGIHPAMVPVVRCVTTVAIKDRHAVNHRPVFAIVSWVERPRELVDELPVDGDEIWRPAAAPPSPPLEFDDEIPF